MEKNARHILLCAAFFGAGTFAFAQNKITGTVKDSQGEPLIGVSIMEEGTSKGTVTDVNGNYTLDVKPGAKLKISYIGFVPAEVKAGEASTIILKEDNNSLNEVVVVGYGTMRRKDVTSSITTVSADDLNRGVYSSPSSLLQGKVAGLTVTQNSDPNGTPNITLRGASTLRTGEAQQPYYVIDGIPGVDLSLVSPDDIESIDVLRDATATAIYGSKAANGVIIITTKKGKKGKVNVGYNGYVAFDNVLKNLDMMTADELRRYAADNGITLANDKGADTDWQKEVQRTAVSHNHNVTINGVNGNTSYNASVNYMNRQGVIRGTDYNKLSGRALVQTSVLKDRLNLAMGINASEQNSSSVYMSDEGISVVEAMNYYSPLEPVRNTDGSYYEASGISQYYNPVAMIDQDRMDTSYRRFQMTAKGDLKLFDGMTWTANYSYMNNQDIYSEYHSINSQVVKKNGQATRDTYFGKKQVFETYGNYNKTFADVHTFGAMLGYSWEEDTQNDGFGLTVYDFYNDKVGYHNLSYANAMDGIDGIQSGAESTLRMISFYGRLNYSYKSKYNLQATLRRDGSSAFGSNNQWATFPSVSAAWRISEEPWVKNLNVFDDLKLRAGYGVSGNSLGFDAYTARMTYGASGWFSFTDANGNTSNKHTLAATNNANPDLKWEKTGMFNIGLDFSFFGSRLSGTIEYYDKRTSDLIYYYPVSTNRYPYNTMTANVGDISNKGIELTVNAVPVKTKDFMWQTTLNLSHNKNVVERLSNKQFSVKYIDTANPNLGGFSSNNVQRLMEGEPIGTFYMWEFAGFNDQGNSTFYVHDKETGKRTGEVTTEPGDADRTIVGNAQPKLTMGWNNTLTYRNWTLDMFFQGVFGNKIFNAMRAQYNSVSNVAMGKNVLAEVADIQHYGDSYSNAPSDRYLENGSYFRLSSLSLSYTFRNLNEWMSGITVYATVNNVFTITGYKGIDPEVELSGITPGMDWRSTRYPHTRTFMLGLKLNF